MRAARLYPPREPSTAEYDVPYPRSRHDGAAELCGHLRADSFAKSGCGHEVSKPLTAANAAQVPAHCLRKKFNFRLAPWRRLRRRASRL